MKTKLIHEFLTISALLLFASASVPEALAGAPAPNSAQTQYEIRFLTGMIDHHHMAVMTGMLCDERAIHQELRELCQEIVATQMAEIELMQTWLQDWYGITHAPEMKRSHEKAVERLASLTGEQFEIEFMIMMIRHHEGAVREGMHCIRRAYHPELIDLCENIVAAQTEEIILMEDWLCEWYVICQ